MCCCLAWDRATRLDHNRTEDPTMLVEAVQALLVRTTSLASLNLGLGGTGLRDGERRRLWQWQQEQQDAVALTLRL